MSFLLPTTSLNRHPQRFETFAAIGTGIAATAATVGSAAAAAAPTVAAVGSLASAGVSAAGAMGAFGGGGGGGATGGLPQFNTTFAPIPNTEYNAGQGAADMLAMFPDLAAFAAQATKFQTDQREKIMPGSKQRFTEASNVLGSWLTGQVPQDVMSFTNRAVAERTGGTFNPATGGGKSQVDFARSIGKLSSDFTQLGVSAAPAWLELANSFVVKPLEVADRAIALNGIRYQYDALNTETNMFNASGGEAGALSEFYSQRDQVYANQAADAANQANAANLASTMTGLAGTAGEVYLKTQNNTVGAQSNPQAVRPSWVKYPGQSAWEQPLPYGAKTGTPMTPTNYRP